MTTIPNTTTVDERDERKRKRAAILKFSLAGAAVLGIGAAATSAAWTDDAWFSAGASAIDPSTAINLQGAYVDSGTPDVSDFKPADTDVTAVQIPVGVFADLTAGDEVTVPVWIMNAGESELQITSADPVTSGDLFAPGGATAELGSVPPSLAADQMVSVDLTISLDAEADADAFGGAEGVVQVQFQGSVANRA